MKLLLLNLLKEAMSSNFSVGAMTELMTTGSSRTSGLSHGVTVATQMLSLEKLELIFRYCLVSPKSDEIVNILSSFN